MGECLMVKPDSPDVPLYIARSMYMWENSDGEKMFHAHWFMSVPSTTTNPLTL